MAPYQIPAPSDTSLTGALRARPGRTAGVVALLILAGAAEGIGVLALLPLLQALVGSTPDSPAARLIVGAVRLAGLRPSAGVLMSCVVLALAAKALFRWLAMVQVGRVVADVAAEMRTTLLRALLGARWSHLSEQRAGALAGTLTRDVFWAAFAYRDACAALAAGIQLAVYALGALAVSWKLGLLAVVAATLATAPLGAWVRASRRAGGLQTRHNGALATRAVDLLQALKPIKAMARESAFLSLLRGDTEALRAAERQHVGATEGLRALQEPLLAAVVVGTVYVALRWGGQSVAALLVVAVLFQRMIGRAHALQAEYQAMVSASAAHDAVASQIASAERAREGGDGDAPAPVLRHALELRDVSFSHGRRAVLRGASLRVPAGSFVAITGPSGAGKTTLLDIVAGLREPAGGHVLVDGVSLTGASHLAWRRTIGYVAQDGALLHDTIAANVALGAEVPPEEIEAALEAAGAAGLVRALPAGADTVVGERGSRLSGGERRRIALARALAACPAGPALLLLDEATAELDAEAAAAIGRTLRSLRGRLTILAVTHHAELAAAADHVYALEDGRLVRREVVRA